MPVKRARSDHLLERAIEALTAALEATGAPWMIIGGIAVIARGVRRFTTDIDAAVRGDAISVARLLKTLARAQIRPRIPDGEAFARANLVLLVRHEPTGVDLDVSLAWSSFEHEALAAATQARFGRARAPMSTAADLVVFKAIAGRARDLDDIEALLVLHPDIDLRSTRKRVIDLATLAEAPELVKTFDAAVRRALRGVVAPRARKTTALKSKTRARRGS